MNLGEMAGKTALDLVKNEGVLNKTSDVMGMLFPYAGLTKKALDMYIIDIENSNMSSDAKLFAILNAKKTIKKLKNQKKVAEIAMNNVKPGTDFTNKSGVSEEWLERFMDSASFVSSEQIQLMWGKILASEFENPNSTPPNMIRILSEITPVYAHAFKKICSMQVLIIPIDEKEQVMGGIRKIIVPYRKNEETMEKMGLSFNVLNELETLGLIKFGPMGDYASTKIPEKKVITYVNERTDVIIEHEPDTIKTGNVMLTAVGNALSKITTLEKIDGYEEMIKQYMIDNRVKYMDNSKYHVVWNDNQLYVQLDD